MEIADNSMVAVCEYCGTQQTIPKLSDDISDGAMSSTRLRQSMSRF